MFSTMNVPFSEDTTCAKPAGSWQGSILAWPHCAEATTWKWTWMTTKAIGKVHNESLTSWISSRAFRNMFTYMTGKTYSSFRAATDTLLKSESSYHVLKTRSIVCSGIVWCRPLVFGPDHIRPPSWPLQQACTSHLWNMREDHQSHPGPEGSAGQWHVRVLTIKEKGEKLL